MGPDLQRLIETAERLERLAAREPDPHADGQAYYEEQRDIGVAKRDAANARRRADDLEKRTAHLRQLIGIARRKLGVPDDAHAEAVRVATSGRVTSTTDCAESELEALLEWYKARGFRVTKPRRAGRAPSAQAMSRQDMLTRIEQLLTEMRLPWGYAEAILRQQRGIADKGVACPISAATDLELRGVIAALWRKEKTTKAKERKAHG